MKMKRQMWKHGVILGLVVVVLSYSTKGIFAQEMPDNVKKMLELAVDNKKAGNIAQYESVHRKIVSEYPGSDFALASQIAIVQNCFDQKDYIAAEKEMTSLRDSFTNTQGIAKGIHDLAQMYKNAGQREEALKWHRYNVAKYPDTFDGAVSQLEIVYDGFERKDYDFVSKEAGFLLDNFSSRPGMSYGVYMVGRKYQDAGFVDKAEKIYRQCVSDAQGLGAMLAQKEIIYNRLSKKSFNEAVSELDLFKDIFVDTEGVSKQLFEIAQRYQRDGRLTDAVNLHRYNVDKYSDTFDGKVSQLEIVYDAFNRKDYDSVDKEANYLLDNFSKSSGMSYGMYMIGKRYQEAGFKDKGLMVYRKCVEDAKGLGAMLSLVGIIDDCFAKNDVASATSYGADLCTRFKDESGITGQLLQLAQKHVSVGDHDTAIKYYKFNMEKYPNNLESVQSGAEIVKAYLAKNSVGSAESSVDEYIARYCGKTTLCHDIVTFDMLFRENGAEGRKNVMLDKLKEALGDSCKSEDVKKRIISLSDLASVYSYQGNHKQVFEIVETLAGYAETIKDVVYDGKHSPYYVFQVADFYFEQAYLNTDNMTKSELTVLFDNAITVLNRLLNVKNLSDAYKTKSYYLAGLCSFYNNDYSRAADYYQKLLGMNGRNEEKRHLDAYYRLPLVYKRMFENKQITSEQCFNNTMVCFEKLQANHKNDKSLESYGELRKGRLCVEYGYYDQAISTFNKYLDVYTNDKAETSEVLYILAEAYEKNGDNTKSRESLNKCVEISPEGRFGKNAQEKLEVIDSL